jgi:hypothetical protein
MGGPGRTGRQPASSSVRLTIGNGAPAAVAVVYRPARSVMWASQPPRTRPAGSRSKRSRSEIFALGPAVPSRPVPCPPAPRDFGERSGMAAWGREGLMGIQADGSAAGEGAARVVSSGSDRWGIRQLRVGTVAVAAVRRPSRTVQYSTVSLACCTAVLPTPYWQW